MNKDSLKDSSKGFLQKNSGIFITLAALGAIEIINRTIFTIPNPAVLYMLAVIYATFAGGYRAGAISAAITYIFAVYYFSEPGRLFHYTSAHFNHMVILLIVTPFSVLLVGILKRRADRAYELEKEAKVLEASIEAQKERGEELEKKVRERTERLNRGLTERMEAEEALTLPYERLRCIERSLIESEKRYRALFENMPAGFVVFEVVQNDNSVPVDLVIVSANKGFEMTTGLKVSEVSGKRLTQVLPGIENDDADWIGTYGRIALTGESRQLELGSELLGAFYSITAYMPVPKQCAVIFLDITERKKADERLKTLADKLLTINRIITTISGKLFLKDILESVLDHVLNATGLEGGTICLVKPDATLQLAAHRATSEATILDLTTNKIRIGECLCGESARNKKPLILRNREEVLEFATRESTRGEDIRFHAAFPMIKGDKCIGVLCIFTRTDKKPLESGLKLIETITPQIALAIENAELYEKSILNAAMLENKVRERTTDLRENQIALVNIVEDLNFKTEELEKANEKLKEIDRLKSIFIASMSHELRTPLNSVIGFSSILLNEWLGTLNQEQKENLAVILKSGKHLLALINDVIDISKIEAGILEVRYTDFDLYDLIIDAVMPFQKEAKEKGLELNIDAPHQIMHTDKRRLLQCLINLASNAVKFTGKGSVRITVQKASSRDEKTNLQLNFVEISVEDMGIGIKQDDLPKLFKPFVRIESPLTAKVPGTGLGLYLAKKLVTEVLKGDIIVKSAYEKGSNFTIRIPVNI